jgi:hypothetical protein
VTFKIRITEERYDAISYACQNIERRIGLNNATDVLAVEDLVREQHFDLQPSVEIPINLWPATVQVLDLAKEICGKLDQRYLRQRQSRLKQLLREDAVTRLARLGGHTTPTT